MPCQHILFGSDGPRASSLREDPLEVWFQPVIDTFEHRILAHECLLREPKIGTGDAVGSFQAAQIRSLAIRMAARESCRSLYFFNLVPSSIDDPEQDMHSTIEAIFEARMHPGNVTFEVAESDLARDPVHSHRIRSYLRRSGFGFALSSSGVGPGTWSFQAISDYWPDYVNLDGRLVQNVDQPASAATISKLVRMSEDCGARVVAQGVDHIGVAENLWLLNIRFMQGHLFGEPANRVADAATLEFAP